MRVLILEDDRDRQSAMSSRLLERFVFLQLSFYDSESSFLNAIADGVPEDVVLISLDHDLEVKVTFEQGVVDCGTGLPVAERLAELKVKCPVIVHTTNATAGHRMIEVLESADCNVERVVPYEGLLWIDEIWFATVRRLILEYFSRLNKTTKNFMDNSFTYKSSRRISQLKLNSSMPDKNQ